MAYSIELHPLAEVELWEAVDWYDAQKPDLGKAFARAIQNTVLAIGENPERFPFIHAKKQKAVIIGYPFVVIFEVGANSIFVLTIFHTSRDPKNWKER